MILSFFKKALQGSVLWMSYFAFLSAQTSELNAPVRRWQVRTESPKESLNAAPNAENTSTLALLTPRVPEPPAKLYVQEIPNVAVQTTIYKVEPQLNLSATKNDSTEIPVVLTARSWKAHREKLLGLTSQNATSSATSLSQTTSVTETRQHETTSRLSYTLRAFNQTTLKLPLEAPRLEVDKSRRNLMVYDGETEVRRYGIDLGRSPQLPKERQGDGRTPEGFYYICTKNNRSAFNLSMGVSYPNIDDARNGLDRGLINRRQFQEIISANETQARPPQNTRLGGSIMIHGTTGYNGDWTEGCIGLRNEDMEELFKIIPLGAPLHISW